ncbi:MAG: hypothetical protein ACFE89_09235 [Candidatus Hodarchaeota archaeon]
MSPEHPREGFTKEMWVVLVLFAFLMLSNGIFIIVLIFFGQVFLFPILLGYAISHIVFFIFIVLAAVYYTRRRS